VDAVLAYDDLLNGLGLKKVRLIGHSVGGLLAAELAAQRGKAIEKLVLISPIGLWREDAPYSCANWCALDADEIMDVLFHDPKSPRVVKRMTPPGQGCGRLVAGAFHLDAGLYRQSHLADSG
jgi:pimeloyl-ACP methyl ester carboxylesterase